MLAHLLLAIDFENFADPTPLQLAGDARIVKQRLRLFPARRMQAGAAWHREPQPIAQGFETEFTFQLTQPHRRQDGADGLAFVIQNTGPDAVAGVGRSGGFALSTEANNARGISRSFAIFFDTHRNREDDDPSGNYVSFCVTSDGYWPSRRLQHSGRLKVNLEDTREHRARIVYAPPRLSVFLDDLAAPVLTGAIDLRSLVGHGQAWVGFTASTGAGFAHHDILRWRMTAPHAESQLLSVESRVAFGAVGDVSCLAGHTLCTPAQGSVEPLAPHRFRIVLPANAPWPVSVPAARATITQANGTICWSPRENGRAACNGPAGLESSADGFLDPRAKPGALIQQLRDGRVYFSVNDRASAFADNEGFFEFEVITHP